MDRMQQCADEEGCSKKSGSVCQEGGENLLTSDPSYRQAQGTPLLTLSNFQQNSFLFFSFFLNIPPPERDYW